MQGEGVISKQQRVCRALEPYRGPGPVAQPVLELFGVRSDVGDTGVLLLQILRSLLDVGWASELANEGTAHGVCQQ